MFNILVEYNCTNQVIYKDSYTTTQLNDNCGECVYKYSIVEDKGFVVKIIIKIFKFLKKAKIICITTIQVENNDWNTCRNIFDFVFSAGILRNIYSEMEVVST